MIEMLCKIEIYISLCMFFPFSGKLVTVLVDKTPRAKTFSHDVCLYDDILVVPRDDELVVMYEITY